MLTATCTVFGRQNSKIFTKGEKSPFHYGKQKKYFQIVQYNNAKEQLYEGNNH